MKGDTDIKNQSFRRLATIDIKSENDTDKTYKLSFSSE